MMLAHADEMMGSATSSGWGQMADVMRDMMGPYRVGGGYIFWQFHWIFELITWVLIIAFLVAAIRWTWKRGGEK